MAHHGSYHHSGAHLSNMGALQEVPRGIITADTRALTPDLWNRPEAAMNALTASRVGASGIRGGSDLPDVTPWVARSRNLPSQVEQAVGPRIGGGSTLSKASTRGASTPRQRNAPLTPNARFESKRVTQRSSPASGATASLSNSASRPDSSSRQPSSTPGTRSMSSRSPVEAPAAADWRNRRTLSSSPTARTQSTTSRRVWDGVRSYRDRSRQDTSTSVRPTYRSSTGGLGSSPGYGSRQTQRSWTERPTSARYFGGFGSSPGYGGSRSLGNNFRPSTTRRSYGGSGSSPGYGRSQVQSHQSRSGTYGRGSSTSRSTAGGRAGSSRSRGRSSSGHRSSGTAVSRGSSSPPPN